MPDNPNHPQKSIGIEASLVSALFLGLSPVFGKQAILLGFSPRAVVALRTGAAALLLLAIIFFARRQAIRTTRVGLVGCLLAGGANGLGSILYYTAIGRLEASVGQMLYATYPLFVGLWLVFDRQRLSKLTGLRLALSIPAVALLVSVGFGQIDGLGVVLMLAAAVLYAYHLVVSQHVLATVSATTATFYILLTMTAVTAAGYFVFDRQVPPTGASWWPIVWMSAAMFFSRFSLFLGVKHVGGLQAALLGLGEMLVTVLVAFFWLGDRLTPAQWLGGALLVGSLLLVGYEKEPSIQPPSRHFAWLHAPSDHTSASGQV